jgi:putative membrane protein
MKATSRFALGVVVGLTLVTALVAHAGLSLVGEAITAVGWGGFALFCLSWAPVVSTLGLAWLAAAPGLPRSRSWAPVWARLIREAAAEVLPLSQLGGLVAGARALIAAGVAEDLALASAMVDVFAEMAGQAVYTMLGLSLAAIHLTGDAPVQVVGPALAGLALLLAVGAAVLPSQRRFVAWLGRLGRRWLPQSDARAAAVGLTLDRIYARKGRVALAAALHLAAWIGSSATSWLALRLMGAEVDLWTVVAVESLMFAIRNIGFALPGGLGVQEGAYWLLAPVLGVPPADALALSLLKRARDIALGAPVLLFWQAHEGWRLLGRPSLAVSRSPKA